MITTMAQDLNIKKRFLSQYLYEINDIEKDFIELKSLSKISDDEIKQICIMAHNLKDVLNFKIERLDDIIHCTYVNNTIKAEYHICLNFKYATINCNLHFLEFDCLEQSSHKVNIGEIHHSSSRVVGYIQVLDYLRMWGYATPYLDYSVEKLIEMEWIKIKE